MYSWGFALVVLFWSSLVMGEDLDSEFQKGRLSSSEVFALADQCRVDKGGRADSQIPWHYCSCQADALRREYSQGGVKWLRSKYQNAKWMQRINKRCSRHAIKKGGEAAGAGMPASLYNRKELGSASIVAAMQACTISKGKFVESRVQLCSCGTDALRVLWHKKGREELAEEMFARGPKSAFWQLLTGQMKTTCQRFER